ncbi:hypothetical protein QR680_003258 [Steinernema hermaphroditum]|uniref:Uncharacterized protein n=1 Tax=Steinernema hermaphroditum TaxID=289476 RepID=A0AA39LJV4_9BILA|nr:hypothetical protein QR680_003258 [Steinernema hermaphroditum]
MEKNIVEGSFAGTRSLPFAWNKSEFVIYQEQQIRKKHETTCAFKANPTCGIVLSIKSMSKLTLEEETKHAHIRISIGCIAKICAIWFTVFFALAICVAFEDNRPKVWDVVTPNVTMRIWYGWSANLCYVDGPGQEDGLLSLLRATQLRAPPHYLLRFAAFFILTVLIVISFCRMACFLKKNMNVSWAIRVFVEVQPIIYVIALLYTSLLLLLNKHKDQITTETYMSNVERFFAFTLSHMVLHTIQDHVDSISSCARTWRNRLRVFCISTVVATVYKVLQSTRDFATMPACHPNIPPMDAVMEYSCLLSILVFYYSTVFDFENVEIIVSTTNLDLDPSNCLADYTPQYMDSSVSPRGHKVGNMELGGQLIVVDDECLQKS